MIHTTLIRGRMVLGLGGLLIVGCAATPLLPKEAVAETQQTEIPLSNPTTSTTQAGQATKITPEQETALVEGRKILRESREVAEEIDAPSKLRELSPPEDQFTRQELNKKGLLARIEKAQFRAGDFSAGATTTVRASRAFAQLHYGKVQDALQVVRSERLGEIGVLAFVYALTQARLFDAAIDIAEAHSKYERRIEGALFALIAREQARLGDTRARDTLQRARMAARFVGPPNDRALSLLHVARVQRSLGDRAGSEESLRWALDAALNAPRDRSTMVLRTIAVAQADNGDRAGSAQLFRQIREEEQSLEPSERVQRLSFQACDLAVRGYRSSATEMFQEATKVGDGLPVGEQLKICSEIGRWLVKSGDQAAVRAFIQRMVETAKLTTDERIRKDILAVASVLAAKVGDLERAVQLASMTNNEWREISLFRVVAEKAIEANNLTDRDAILRQLSIAIEGLPRSPLPNDRSQADGRLADIAKIQAVAGDIQSAMKALQRMVNQDSHQGSGAYPEIIKLLAQQGNFAGALQIIGSVERKWLQEVPMASALQSLGKAYAETGETQTALVWARHMKVDYAQASILLGVAEGLMNRQGIEKIVEERPELTLQAMCSLG